MTQALEESVKGIEEALNSITNALEHSGFDIQGASTADGLLSFLNDARGSLSEIADNLHSVDRTLQTLCNILTEVHKVNVPML